MIIGDFEDRLLTSAPITSASFPTSFKAQSQELLLARELAYIPSYSSFSHKTITMGGNEGGGRGPDRWSLFGMHPSVQKSPTDPGSDSNAFGGFNLQSYFGLQKSSTLDSIKTQVKLSVEDPVNTKASSVDVMSVEEKKAAPHKLKHRDMNILTPSGF